MLVKSCLLLVMSALSSGSHGSDDATLTILSPSAGEFLLENIHMITSCLRLCENFTTVIPKAFDSPELCQGSRLALNNST